MRQSIAKKLLNDTKYVRPVDFPLTLLIQDKLKTDGTVESLAGKLAGHNVMVLFFYPIVNQVM